MMKEENEGLNEFCTVWYIYDVLGISEIEYYFDEKGYFFKFEVVNDDNEWATFTIPFYKLSDYKTALPIFAQYLGRKPIALPKGLEERTWELVIEDMKEQARAAKRAK